MKLIKKIGAITLDNPIEWTNYDVAQDVMAESQGTINGGVIVWELAVLNTSKFIDVSSGSNFGFQTSTTKDSILALVRNSIGTTTTITTYEDEIISVRFRHEDTAIEISDIIGARGSEFFSINIKLARI